MSRAIPTERTRMERITNAVLRIGGPVFSFAIIALAIETMVCAKCVSKTPGPRYKFIPILPFLPAIPWLAYVFGTVFAACGVGLLFKRTVRPAALALGSLLFLCALILEVPTSVANIGSVSLRTEVFEPLALACLAWLLPGRDAARGWLERASRYLLALSLIVFGVDHFLALAPIGTLIPNWIPWHVFWIAFFGAGFIAAGLSIGLNFLLRWGAACIGLMFAIWVFTLHLPRVLGLYGIPGAPRSPAEWSSLFIAIALWGGSWALHRCVIPLSQEWTPVSHGEKTG
jgi:uncharacterized membrane protein